MRSPAGYDVVFHSVHEAVEGGHGGNRRLSQLVELLGPSASSVTCSQDSFSGSRLAKALRRIGIARGPVDLDKIHARTLLVFDSYLRGYEPVFARARAAGAKLAVFPQNLDSLTAGSVDPLGAKRAPGWFHEELGVLRKADLAVCLGREDQWLLSLYGIPSFYFPYYPTRGVRKELDALRARRAATRKDKFVILGSAVNRPTLDGMKDLLDNAAALTAAAGSSEVVLAGYGTEELQAAGTSRRIRVAGGISNQAMHELLASARAAICCQAAATGALTRIPELLCAGIPVIAPYTAARSCFHLDGMHVAESAGHLCQLVRDLPSTECPAPEPPVQYEQRLLSAIAGLWNEANSDGLRG